eukprot:m.164139 g.164139  ORF g.164139 m.164139 type:complete len:1643 (-) comp13422_c0_seq2:1128-6056(-)
MSAQRVVIGPDPEVVKTGGEVDGMLMALIEHANDGDKEVKKAFHSAIRDIGRQQPILVLSSCETFLHVHKKLDLHHRIILIQLMRDVVYDAMDHLPAELANRIVRLAAAEMTFKEEIVPDWQSAASSLIVSIGSVYGEIVLEIVKEMFQAGSVPHYFVVKTMADLAMGNVFSVVPQLPEIIGRCLPMLGMVKHDNMKWVFSVAFSKFSEAILNYTANKDRANDQTVTVARFSESMYSAFEVFQGVWLQSKEVKLRQSVVETIGLMAHILSREKLEKVIDTLVPAIISQYKGKFTSDTLAVTKGLCMVLDAATHNGDRMLEPQIDTIFNSLHPLLLWVPPSTDHDGRRNYNELLRCFEKLCQPFSSLLLSFLFVKLEVPNEKSRIGSLRCLKHLINSSGDSLRDKKELIVTGLKPLLETENINVKHTLALVISALAHHDYLHLEGGENLVRFIVQQSSITEERINQQKAMQGKKKKGGNEDDITPVLLRSTCDNILIGAAKTMSCTDLVLWPFLLQFIVPMENNCALPVLCQCLSFLADKLGESDSYDIDFDTEVNLPSPYAIFARLLVVIATPHYRNRGVLSLRLLQAMSINFHDKVEELWDGVIPKLISHFETNGGSDVELWVQTQRDTWEELLLKFLRKTLDIIDEEAWTLKLGDVLCEHYALYTHEYDRSMVSKFLGIVLRKCTKKDFLDAKLVQMFESVDHTNQLQRDGCARGFGYAAGTHLDTVLERLQFVAKRDMVRKSTGFFGMIKDKSEADVARIKATLMLSYGYVTLMAPTNLITSRIEVNILSSILPHFANVKDTLVKENLIRSVELIGKALRPEKLKADAFVLHRRGELIQFMQQYMQQENKQVIGTETRALCMDACSQLIELQPKLTEADLFQLLEVAIGSVFHIVPPPVDDTTAEATANTTALIEQSRKSLNELVSVVVRKDPSTTCIQNILKHLGVFLMSEHDHQRMWMMELYETILQVMYESVQQTPLTNPRRVEAFGKFLADLVPRSADPVVFVRKYALSCIQILLHINRLYQCDPNDEDVVILAMTKLQERAENGESQALFSLVNDLSKVLAKKISSDELMDILYPLIQSLTDRFTDSGDGCCVVINGLFKLRGAELGTEVDAIIEALHLKLDSIQQERTQTGVLRAIRTLAVHHADAVRSKLLGFEAPLSVHVQETWHTLAADKVLCPKLLKDIIDIMNSGLPYQVSPDGTYTATSGAVRATCALRELLSVEEAGVHATAVFCDLLTQILLRLSCAVFIVKEGGVDPLADAIDTLRHFLERTGSDFVLKALDEAQAWAWFGDAYMNCEAFKIVIASLCNNKPDVIPTLVDLFDEVMKRVYDTQRVLAVIVFAEVINQRCAGDLSLMIRLRNGLLAKTMDQNHIVRKWCMMGLGNIASLPDEHIRKHTTAVLSAVMTGMDDRNDPDDEITLEAMRTLNKIFEKVEEDTIRNILINISLRIRPCFEKEKPAVRAAAIELFGNLSQFGDGPSRIPFLEQIHSNMVSLILHRCESDQTVCSAVGAAFVNLAPLLGSEDLSKLLQDTKDMKSFHYGEFLNNITKVLIKDFRDKISFYTMNTVDFFHSNRGEIRGNAAMMIGNLLRNLKKDDRKDITKEHVCSELIRLLRDPNGDVKQKGAEAMSLLYDY